MIFANDAAARLCGFDSAEALLAAPGEETLGRFEVFREDGAPFPRHELPGRLALRGRSQALSCDSAARGPARSAGLSSPVRRSSTARAIDLAVSVFREFTDRRRSEEAWQFLAEASAAFSASLDYEQTLKQVAELAVPRIADWSAVDILSPDGSLEPLAVAHVDPSKRELAREWRRRWPPRPDATQHQVIRTGHPGCCRRSRMR